MEDNSHSLLLTFTSTEFALTVLQNTGTVNISKPICIFPVAVFVFSLFVQTEVIQLFETRKAAHRNYDTRLLFPDVYKLCVSIITAPQSCNP